jgi:hypothetical protein
MFRLRSETAARQAQLQQGRERTVPAHRGLQKLGLTLRTSRLSRPDFHRSSQADIRQQIRGDSHVDRNSSTAVQPHGTAHLGRTVRRCADTRLRMAGSKPAAQRADAASTIACCVTSDSAGQMSEENGRSASGRTDPRLRLTRLSVESPLARGLPVEFGHL